MIDDLEPIEITPEDSVVPVFLDERPQVPVTELGPGDLQLIEQEAKEAALLSAIEKLKKLGLTAEEVRSISGLS